jgi:hypothetical protein
MIPTTQTILAGDPSGVQGNCLQAAVASLLDLPLDEVPHFAEHEDWLERLCDFGAEHGFKVIYRPPATEGVTGLAFGPSARGVKHAVVWVNGEMAWDPHPDRSGLLSVSMLLAFDPVGAAR